MTESQNLKPGEQDPFINADQNNPIFRLALLRGQLFQAASDAVQEIMSKAEGNLDSVLADLEGRAGSLLRSVAASLGDTPEPFGYVLKGREWPNQCFYPASHRPTDLNNWVAVYDHPDPLHDDKLPYMLALAELVRKIGPDLNSGDLLADARAASIILDHRASSSSAKPAAPGDGGGKGVHGPAPSATATGTAPIGTAAEGLGLTPLMGLVAVLPAAKNALEQVWSTARAAINGAGMSIPQGPMAVGPLMTTEGMTEGEAAAAVALSTAIVMIQKGGAQEVIAPLARAREILLASVAKRAGEPTPVAVENAMAHLRAQILSRGFSNPPNELAELLLTAMSIIREDGQALARRDNLSSKSVQRRLVHQWGYATGDTVNISDFEDFKHAFWVMLKECESQADSTNSGLLRHQVEGWFRLWGRLSGDEQLPAWRLRAVNSQGAASDDKPKV